VDPYKRSIRTGPRASNLEAANDQHPWQRPLNQDVSALSGALSEISVATVLTLFEMERRSGVVLLQAGTQRGQIGLRAGKIVRAAVQGVPTLTGKDMTGKEALYRLLGWQQGRFEYRPGAVKGADELRRSTSHLLLEAARRSDEHGEGDGWAGETPA
jgi:two-component system, OmpR family, response regulator